MKPKKYNLIFLIFLFGLTIFVGYLSILRFENSQLQFQISSDIYQNTFKDKDLEFINNIDYSFPNLNIFSMPLGAIKAKYLIEKDSLDQALKLLYETRNHNPFLMFNEYNLADIYGRRSEIDSFNHYSRYIIQNLPNNPVHFVLYGKKLQMENKTDSVFYYFDQIDSKVKKRDPQLWKIILAAVAADSAAIRKFNAKELALEAKSLFDDEQVNLLSDIVLFSKKNIDEAMNLETIAMTRFNEGDIKESIKIFEQIIDLHPTNIQYFNGLVKVHYYTNNFNEVQRLYDDYLVRFKDIDSEMLYLFSVAIINNGNLALGCQNIDMIVSNTRFNVDRKILSACGY